MKTHSRLHSFAMAISGIVHMMKAERNFQIHGTASIVVCMFGYVFHLSFLEWGFIIICITLVLLTEMFNTAIEEVCNKITMESCPTIKIIKDVSAGAVLTTTVCAAIIGAFIFAPKCIALFYTWRLL